MSSTIPTRPEGNTLRVQALLERGVVIPCPDSVEFDESVQLERIEPGAVIHSACRIRGAETWISSGCEIGSEAPATIENCQLGRNVALKGGYFSGATFLDGASVGSGAHVRSGTLLEEEASAAHAVGFKQTIFLPFVTAGSLINFCDALMSGGTSRKNHSEIGSSYIHFNFTPHQDKATASLVGDVPRGVMLDQSPIFLGGQGGLVGPARIGFGSLIPAGVIFREDAPEGGQLLVPTQSPAKTRPFQVGAYRDIRRILRNNLIYIGNIRALQAWYSSVRKLFERDAATRACYDGARKQLAVVLEERIRRLGELAEKMPRSIELARPEFRDSKPAWLSLQEQFAAEWPRLRDALESFSHESIATADRDNFFSAVQQPGATQYLEAIRALDSRAKAAGTRWLQAIVESVCAAGETLFRDLNKV